MRFVALAASAASLALVACQNSTEPRGSLCPDVVLYAVRATISGADSAVVKITDGAYADSVSLRRTSNPNSMVALLGANRAGTYTLTARSPEYLTQTFDNVVATADECGPFTRIFNIVLQRERLPG